MDGREHGGIIAAVGRHVPEACAVYARVFTAANNNEGKRRDRSLQGRLDGFTAGRRHAEPGDR
jgi:hypothetical protein